MFDIQSLRTCKGKGQGIGSGKDKKSLRRYLTASDQLILEPFETLFDVLELGRSDCKV
ncbi:hypothetical protein ES703_24177 [subsurface metagenome]